MISSLDSFAPTLGDQFQEGIAQTGESSVFSPHAYREEAPSKIHGGCGLIGICDESGTRMSGEVAISGIKILHDRGNGKGGGFAGYGIYPDMPEHYAFHLMYSSVSAREETERYLSSRYLIDKAEDIPVRKTAQFIDAPILRRYFMRVHERALEECMLSETDYVVATVMHVNSVINGAFVASSGKNMGAFKGVGYPEDIGHFFKLEEYEAHTWVGHNRFPTNTPGWWGGAHPFTLLDWSIVHNGEISSYGANRHYLEQHGYVCALGTDTEVAAYLFDLLVRRHRLPLEVAAKVLAPPLWDEIDGMDARRQELFTALRVVYGAAMLNGPFALVLGFRDGMIALNDRIKLRPLVVGRQKDRIMVASEEAAINAVFDAPDDLFAPKAGEPIIARVRRSKEGAADVS